MIFQTTSNYAVTDRARSHRGNAPTLPKTKQCSLCPAQFTRTTHLNRHIRSHTNERCHRCDVCGAEFTRSDLLTRHRKTCREAHGAPRSRRRSCQSCVKSKVKCDLIQPCSRCASQRKDCIYINEPGDLQYRNDAASDPGIQFILPSPTLPWSAEYRLQNFEHPTNLQNLETAYRPSRVSSDQPFNQNKPELDSATALPIVSLSQSSDSDQPLHLTNRESLQKDFFANSRQWSFHPVVDRYEISIQRDSGPSKSHAPWLKADSNRSPLSLDATEFSSAKDIGFSSTEYLYGARDQAFGRIGSYSDEKFHLTDAAISMPSSISMFHDHSSGNIERNRTDPSICIGPGRHYSHSPLEPCHTSLDAVIQLQNQLRGSSGYPAVSPATSYGFNRSLGLAC